MTAAPHLSSHRITMIERRFGHRWVAAAAAALLAACVPAVSGNPASGSLPPGFDARTVELRSHWMGVGGVSTDWVVLLERQGDTYTFTGTSEMSVYEAGDSKQAGPLPITVPDSAMRAFLRVLASAPRHPGVYETIYTHTDDYPNFTMTLRSAAGVVEFFSDSQSDRNWRVTFGGQRYVSDSPVPFQAQDHIKGFYRVAELGQILRAAGWRRE
jgi:hypothetical protein